jgi:predicted cupin superfamily sugar epimerase
MKPEQVIERLKLQPLPVEGGYFRELYRSENCSTIFYMITQTNFSALHKLISDEIYHFYLGDPVQLETISPEGEHQTILLGNDIAYNHQLIHVVPRDHWQGSRLAPNGSFALLGCTVNPAFRFEDCQHATGSELLNLFPQHADVIERLTRK